MEFKITDIGGQIDAKVNLVCRSVIMQKVDDKTERVRYNVNQYPPTGIISAVRINTDESFGEELTLREKNNKDLSSWEKGDIIIAEL